MSFNKKKKNIKDLDNVFQIIEEKENIAETDEEKELKSNKEKEMKKIKIILISILVFLAVLTVVYVAYTIFENKMSKYATLKSKNRTDYIIRNVDETLLSNYLQPGKKTVVQFWASWCPYCVNESDALNKLMLEYSDMNIIIVSHDREMETLTKYLNTNSDYDWFVIYDTEKTIRSNLDSSATTIPRTYILDDKGNIVDKITSSATYDELKNLFERNQ